MGLFPVQRARGGAARLVFQEKANNVRVVAVFIRPEHQIHPPSCLQSKISLVRSTLRIKSQRGTNRSDKQLEVEPEEKFVAKNATAAVHVVHLQDRASPKKKLVSTVKMFLYVNFHVVM